MPRDWGRVCGVCGVGVCLCARQPGGACCGSPESSPLMPISPAAVRRPGSLGPISPPASLARPPEGTEFLHQVARDSDSRRCARRVAEVGTPSVHKLPQAVVIINRPGSWPKCEVFEHFIHFASVYDRHVCCRQRRRQQHICHTAIVVTIRRCLPAPSPSSISEGLLGRPSGWRAAEPPPYPGPPHSAQGRAHSGSGAASGPLGGSGATAALRPFSDGRGHRPGSSGTWSTRSSATRLALTLGRRPPPSSCSWMTARWSCC